MNIKRNISTSIILPVASENSKAISVERREVLDLPIRKEKIVASTKYVASRQSFGYPSTASLNRLDLLSSPKEKIYGNTVLPRFSKNLVCGKRQSISASLVTRLSNISELDSRETLSKKMGAGSGWETEPNEMDTEDSKLLGPVSHIESPISFIVAQLRENFLSAIIAITRHVLTLTIYFSGQQKITRMTQCVREGFAMDGNGVTWADDCTVTDVIERCRWTTGIPRTEVRIESL